MFVFFLGRILDVELDLLDLLLEIVLVSQQCVLLHRVKLILGLDYVLRGRGGDLLAARGKGPGVDAELEVFERGVHHDHERDDGAALEVRLDEPGQLVVALGDVALHARLGQHHAAQRREAAVDVHGLVEPLVGVLVLVAELLAASQVHESDRALDGLLVARHDLVELRVRGLDECDLDGENGVRARAVDVGLVGRRLALLEAPVEHGVEVGHVVDGDLVHVAHGGPAVEHLGLGLLLKVRLGHGVDVQLRHLKVGHLALLGHTRVLLVRARGLLAHLLTIVLVDLQLTQVLHAVVLDFDERAADGRLVLRLQVFEPRVELLDAARDQAYALAVFQELDLALRIVAENGVCFPTAGYSVG